MLYNTREFARRLFEILAMRRRIPLPAKVLYTLFVAVLGPYYLWYPSYNLRAITRRNAVHGRSKPMSRTSKVKPRSSSVRRTSGKLKIR